MTDIGVYTTAFQAEDLSWDLSNPGVPYVEGGVIDVSLFTAAQHYPNGYIPSGTVLGKKTTGGKLGPYLDAATDGTQTAVGILRASIHVLKPNGSAKGLVGCAVLKAFGVIDPAKLPFTSSNAAAGGYIDANGKADLTKLHFTS